MRVFLDANILFSSASAGSVTARVLQRIQARGTAITCEYAAEEAARNIQANRRAWLPTYHALLSGIQIVKTEYFALPVPLAPKDVPILCSAIRAECNFLVTSDKRDFGHLFDQSVHGVTIVSLLRRTEKLV